MKTIAILITAFFMSGALSAQPQPVKWTVNVSKAVDGVRTLTATATIDEGWHLYSQHTDPEGPVPTTFSYEGVTLVGATEELSNADKTYSDLFELEVIQFDTKAVFQQKIKASPGSKMVTATINFMCCDGDKCLPPSDVEFTMQL